MSLHLKASKTALVLIDLQHGIVGRSLQPHSADEVVKASRLMAEVFRAKGGKVVYVRIDLANMFQLSVDISHSHPNAAHIPATASEIVPEAGFQEGDLLITKRHWGAFGQTELERVFKEQGVGALKENY